MNRTITQATLDAIKAADYTKEFWHYPLIVDNPGIPEFVKGYMSHLFKDLSSRMRLNSDDAHDQICDVMSWFTKAS